MSLINTIAQVKFNFNNLKNEFDMTVLENCKNFPAWNNHSLEDVRSQYDAIISILEEAIELNDLENVPLNFLISLSNSIAAILNNFRNLKNQLNQQHYHQLSSQISSLRGQLRTFGIEVSFIRERALDELRLNTGELLSQLEKEKKEFLSLKKDLGSYVGGAVSSALSDSFKKRKDSLWIAKSFWLFLFIGVGYVTYGDTRNISKEIEIVYKTSIEKEAQNESTKSTSDLLIVWLVRLLSVSPNVAALWFIGTQYLKERHFEEEVAHKASVASSLKNYSELSSSESTQNEIISAASNVVFSPPSYKDGWGGVEKNLKKIAEITSHLK
ncbi:hypothetical protein M899_2276 [Bacteriovorax sp. BSW11_IV]|uniref:hypothetical protein n=1 Tax=Bacteriovorax sp. BSW11_IV TaxID=1353529 RepID=UPI00038A37F6|nr:hypothetical protein [Bacteriovorax sp. BSW11_IV]EQC48795.1 hypothetical protein M899_2276 [Bacteriovorax sp. BSW11_IV]